jgi:hypothetical protein
MRLTPSAPPHKLRSLARQAWRGARRFLLLVEATLVPPPIDVGLRRILVHTRLRRLSAPLAQQRAHIEAILRAMPFPRAVVVFLPGLDWHVPLFQRPQQMARALARRGALVFYIQPPAFEGEGTITEVEPHLYLCAVPVEAFREIGQAWHYVLTWNARRYLPAIERPHILYDYVDDIDAFHGNHAAMRKDHRRLLARAEVVLATAHVLHEEVLRARPDALLVANGVEYEHFARARHESRGDPPAELAPVVARGRPIVGYHGALARWFDYDLVAEVARRRPDLSFVLIGPDFDFSLRDNSLPALPNVTWLGARPYAELPRYLAWLDVGIIPFRKSAVTHATSPIKLFEYMAAGIPVVISPMAESMQQSQAIVADTPEAWGATLDRAIKLGRDEAFRAALEFTARSNTWEMRAEQVLSTLEERALRDRGSTTAGGHDD